MSAANEDSQMISSPEEASGSSDLVQTPKDSTFVDPATLSPPDSGHSDRNTSRAMPTAAPGSNGANSNGKRPIQTISNGMDDLEGEG